MNKIKDTIMVKKLMVGMFAGLMILQGSVQAVDKRNDDNLGKKLFKQQELVVNGLKNVGSAVYQFLMVWVL